jgi:HAD superfamily hydrolase (TIGR01549 family)
MTTPSLILPRAVLFDMDGTLTAPWLNFAKIRAEIGIGEKAILEAIMAMAGDARRAAEAILHRHEEEAAEGSTLNDGCREVLAWLEAPNLNAGERAAAPDASARERSDTGARIGSADFTGASRRIATALITRNSRRSVASVLQKHGLKLDILITREDCAFKPDPAPLLMACRELGVTPEQAWMVGDGKYDVEAANAAGIRCLWISHGAARPFAAEPWRTVKDLHGVLMMLKSCVADCEAS